MLPYVDTHVAWAQKFTPCRFFCKSACHDAMRRVVVALAGGEAIPPDIAEALLGRTRGSRTLGQNRTGLSQLSRLQEAVPARFQVPNKSMRQTAYHPLKYIA